MLLQRHLFLPFCLAIVLGQGACFTRPVMQEVIDEKAVEVTLRKDVRWRTPVEKGFQHPLVIAPVRLAHVLSRIDLRPPKGPLISFGEDPQRAAAIPTAQLFAVAEGLSKALAQADPDQEVVVRVIETERALGVFNHEYLTSLVAYARDERLYVHLVHHRWEVPKRREDRIPQPRIGDRPQRFKVHPSTAMSLVNAQTVAIDWRDEVFARATRTQVLPSGDVVRKKVLMESPNESPPIGSLPSDLSPEQLRALADLEEARSAGRLTETEYRGRRREILEPAS